MKVYAQIKKGKYIDSLETLFSSSVLNEQPGVDVGYVGMATASFKDILAEIGLMTEEIDGCGDNDYVIVARAESEEAFCALPGFVDSKNEEKTERNAGYLVVSQSGGGMLRQGTREGIRRTPANRGMRAHRVVKGLDISEDVCHGLCP